jgi:hypothetical protein
MDRTRVVRWLRLSASALCLIVCVGLIGLWVRSYWRTDIAKGAFSETKSLCLESLRGRLFYQVYDSDYPFHWAWKDDGKSPANWQVWTGKKWSWSTKVNPSGDWHIWESQVRPWHFVSRLRSDTFAFVLPLWFPVLIFATLAAVPWLPWPTRFSVKTMLIVTTLVAVVLGLIVKFSFNR